MILDEEVFAVILAVSIISSALGVALVLKPENPEPFSALGLLNEECKIGDYPKIAINNSLLRLCIYVANYMGRPTYYKVVYKLAHNETLPSKDSPSPEPAISEWRLVLAHGENKTVLVDVVVYDAWMRGRVALVFELWTYDSASSSWVYTGVWNHLYIDVVSV